MQEINIDIDQGGNLRIDVTGVEGPECEQLTKAIEEAVGVVTKRMKKPEYARPKTRTHTASA